MPGLYPTAYRATFPAFFMRLALVCFYCLCVFVHVLYFIATMSFAGYFLPVLFCMLSMLISDSRFDLVWFRLSCDHGWIRSGSVNVRKKKQKKKQLQSSVKRASLVRELFCRMFLRRRYLSKTTGEHFSGGRGGVIACLRSLVVLVTPGACTDFRGHETHGAVLCSIYLGFPSLAAIQTPCHPCICRRIPS